jgi:hypothetical protein
MRIVAGFLARTTPSYKIDEDAWSLVSEVELQLLQLFEL